MKAKGTQFTDDARAVEHYGYDRRVGTHGGVFHGPQTEVLPADLTGVEKIHTETYPEYAYYNAHKYYEPDVAERKGWNWAHQATNVESNRASFQGGAPLGRPVVHEVAPKKGSTVDMDPYAKIWRAPEAGSLVSDRGLDITDTHWIPPVSPAHAKGGVIGHQGTLPHVNWNEFGAKGLEQKNWEVLRASK